MIFAYYIFMFSEVKLLFEPVLPSVASVGQLVGRVVGWLACHALPCSYLSFFVRIAYEVCNASFENKAKRLDMVAWLAGNRM